MKIFTPFSLLAISLFFIQSCADQKAGQPPAQLIVKGAIIDSNNKGYWENGDIITKFDCPDAVEKFPPIEIRSWEKVPVVNNTLPTLEQTKNGMSIHHYGGNSNPDVEPYNITLPKLAYYIRNDRPDNSSYIKAPAMLPQVTELVVVIQIVQTAEDTIVGFRYLTGGCGGSLFHDFHFLNDDEVKNVVGL